MHVKRAYRAGQLAWQKGLPPDAPATADDEYRAEFKRGWQDERRKHIATGGRPRTLHR